MRHTLACLLARVAGRSQLEYMTPDERARQCAVVLALLTDVPPSLPALVDIFVEHLEHHANH